MASLKALTIPRQELIATHFTKFKLNTIPSCDPSVYKWFDSQIVLDWVSSDKPLPIFVSHHVSEMKSLLPNAAWKYCPTPENFLEVYTTTEVLTLHYFGTMVPSGFLIQLDGHHLTCCPILPLVLAAAQRHLTVSA